MAGRCTRGQRRMQKCAESLAAPGLMSEPMVCKRSYLDTDRDGDGDRLITVDGASPAARWARLVDDGAAGLAGGAGGDLSEHDAEQPSVDNETVIGQVVRKVSGIFFASQIHESIQDLLCPHAPPGLQRVSVEPGRRETAADPHAILAGETVDCQAGLSLWTRQDVPRYAFLHLDGDLLLRRADVWPSRSKKSKLAPTSWKP
jgi:hypothetical protein